MDTQERKRSGSAGQRSGSRQRPVRSGQRQAAPPPRRRSGPAGSRQRDPAKKRPPRSTQPRRKKPVSRQRPKKPEVVYTPPAPFSRNRFLLRLLTVAAVVLAVTFGMSIFFKVRTVTVSGAELYSPWAVREASGITEGSSLLALNRPRAGGRITAALPYVKSVRIGIKLPDTVNIEIVETQVIYSVLAQDGSWWLISSDGKVMDKTDQVHAGDYTRILGVQLADPVKNEQAVAAEGDATDLETALAVARALEENGFIGDAASVDVTDSQALEVWYGTRYQVKLGDGTDLDYKIRCMGEAIGQMSQYQSGELDVTFTLWPDKVVYTPFSQ